ncbi:MAG: Linear gramicidin synthase subunit D [Phycisphaerae bacterium]|nr:Linear gramicidin synthase subunit D [Phycisphaerae bacterium]
MGQVVTTFLTGGTGFIGQYLLRELLRRERRVVMLLRGQPAESRRRLASLMQPLGVAIDDAVRDGQLLLVDGQLPDQLPVVTQVHVDQIIHSAACRKPLNDEPNGEPFHTNVYGVERLAQWALDHGVRRMDFISTAYTCGRSIPRAYEEFYDPQPPYETDYEVSKWQAEKLLLNWSQRHGVPLTILRPSLVIGDSQTGYTTQYEGFYQLVRVISMLAKLFSDQRDERGLLELPLRIPAQPTGTQNLVPVDWVAAAITEIAGQPLTGQAIYNLTNPCPPQNEKIKSFFEGYYRLRGGYYVQEVDRARSASMAENMFLNMHQLVFRQFNYTPEFDCTNTTRALQNSGITFPTVNNALLAKLIDYAEQQQWGRLAASAAS